jgi:TIR domain-containing protein
MSPTPPAPPIGDRPTVFISYSHVDETWKDRVVKHLRVLEPAGVLEVWHDRHIAGGDDWLAEIQGAMVGTPLPSTGENRGGPGVRGHGPEDRG